MLKCVVELGPCGISYEARRAIKAQVLANFITKCWVLDEPKGEDSLNKGSKASLITVSPNGRTFKCTCKLIIKASNNAIKYKVVLVGMKIHNALEQNTSKPSPIQNCGKSSKKEIRGLQCG